MNKKRFLENCKIEYENREYNRLHPKNDYKNNLYFIIEPDNKGIRFINKNGNWQLANNWNDYKNKRMV